MDWLTNALAALSEQYHLRIFFPRMSLRVRLLFSLGVAPAMALIYWLEKGQVVSASLFGGTLAMGVLVTLLVHVSVERRNRKINTDTDTEIRRSAEGMNASK